MDDILELIHKELFDNFETLLLLSKIQTFIIVYNVIFILVFIFSFITYIKCFLRATAVPAGTAESAY